MSPRLVIALAPLFAIACLEPLPDEPGFPVMCEVTADCAGAGQVCDEGVCWGDPPEGAQFAALLVPPDGRDDLVRTDIGELLIAADGWFGDLGFADSIVVSGRISLSCDEDADPTLCDDTTSIAAQVRVQRPSSIPGGPAYNRNVDAIAGTYPGELAFTVRLPRLAASSQPYEVTVVPQSTGKSDEGFDPVELAPPVRFELDGSTDHTQVDWVLGQPEDHKIVIGRVIDAADRGIAGMQVFARGRWADGDELARGSSVSRTDDNGLFALRIPIDMLDFYDLVVLPAPGMAAPTLTSSSLFIPDPDVIESPDRTVFVSDLRMPSYPAPGQFVLPVVGTDPNGTGIGEVVAGAAVELATVLYDDGMVTATYVASGTTDTSGEVELTLIPAGTENREYLARVTPPPSSSHATLGQKLISVGPGQSGNRSVLSAVSLTSRTLVTGSVWSAAGEPVVGATVSPRASVALRLAQSQALQSSLANLSFPSVTTDAQGGFRLWLDPVLFGIAARYDLEVVPPALSAAPRWSLDDLALAALTPEQGLSVSLPPSSFARGTVRDADGNTVDGAEVWLFQINGDDGICQNANLPAGVDCVPPALLRGLWQSRKDGEVWVVLPDIDAYSAGL